MWFWFSAPESSHKRTRRLAPCQSHLRTLSCLAANPDAAYLVWKTKGVSETYRQGVASISSKETQWEEVQAGPFSEHLLINSLSQDGITWYHPRLFIHSYRLKVIFRTWWAVMILLYLNGSFNGPGRFWGTLVANYGIGSSCYAAHQWLCSVRGAVAPIVWPKTTGNVGGMGIVV